MSRGLIVVEVQNDFCEGSSVPVSGGARIATQIADLVDYSVEVAPDTINSALDDFREAGIAVSGGTSAPQ